MCDGSWKRRVCITGGGGFLGQSVAKSFQLQGCYTVLLDCQFIDFPNIKLDPNACRKVQGSILDRSKVEEAFSGCESVIHIAGYGMSGGASLDREKNFEVNVRGTRIVLDECIKSETVRRFVFTSSIVVIFSGEELHFATEDAPYSKKFLNAYMETKCLAEKSVLEANQSPNFSTCALRFRGIYGPGEIRTTQRSINLIGRGFAKATFSLSKQCRTQYSSVENAVNAIVLADKALQKENSPAAGQVYNIVDDGVVDPWEFWNPMFRLLNRPIPSLRIPFCVAYGIATILELVYHWFKVEPLFTRLEVLMMSVTNTFSIERAKRDLDYRPIRSHDLGPIIEFCQKQMMREKSSDCTGEQQNKELESVSEKHLKSRTSQSVEVELNDTNSKSSYPTSRFNPRG